MMRRDSTRLIWSNPVNPEWLFILALCFAAAVRVSIFATAFPFFTNIDEQNHIDVILKYSRGYWPAEPEELFDLASERLFSLYGTWEYLHHPEKVTMQRKIPLCILPPEMIEHLLSQRASTWSTWPNFETLSPPTYYVVASLFYRMAGLLGFQGIERLYVLRLMNALFAGLLVLAAYLLCAQEFPQQGMMRRGVPLLTAFVPSEVFYTVNCDVLSPLLFTLALWVGLRWYRSAKPSLGLGISLGLLICATFLVKLTNIALPIVFLLACAWRVAVAFRERIPCTAWKIISIPALTAALPLLLWIFRNYAFFGDLTGNAAKLRMLGWSWKSPAEMFDHPLFTTEGFWTFWSVLINSLWRGQIFWHGTLLHSLWADWVYSLSSTVFILAALASAVWHCVFKYSRIRHPLPQTPFGEADRPVCPCPCETEIAIILSVLVSILCMMWLSLAFDFGDLNAPTRAYPYLSSGRLIVGALVPLFVLYVQGLYSLLPRGHRDALCLAALFLLCVGITISDIMVNSPVFGSWFNLWHLWMF
jgi:hypothetical protein